MAIYLCQSSRLLHHPTVFLPLGSCTYCIGLQYTGNPSSELYLAIGSEPWRIPDISSLPSIESNVADPEEDYVIYRRDPETLARKLAFPGTPGQEHRVGDSKKMNQAVLVMTPPTMRR